jgi:energy-coupling factor transport system ATP-binding protein
MDIRIKNLSFRYKSVGASPEQVLKNIDIQINSGDFVALVGSSGSGKTTLLQHLTGLLKPDEGTISIAGKNIWGKGIRLSEFRRRIGIVFQFPETQLFEETVFEDIAFGPRNLGLPEHEIKKRVSSALKWVGLAEDVFRHRSPLDLSSGEKRRVAIAGVLAFNPDVLALDEPTAGLDASGIRAIIDFLKMYNDDNKSIIFVSHNLDLVLELCDRIVVMEDGEVRFDGDKRQLLHRMTELNLPLPRISRVVEHLQQMGVLDSGDFYAVEPLLRELTRRCRAMN